MCIAVLRLNHERLTFRFPTAIKFSQLILLRQSADLFSEIGGRFVQLLDRFGKCGAAGAMNLQIRAAVVALHESGR